MAATTVSFLWINTIYSEVNLDLLFNVSLMLYQPEVSWTGIKETMPQFEDFESYSVWLIQIYWRQQARLGLRDARGEGPASQTSTVCKLCSDGVLCCTVLNLLSPCWSNPTWILHMMEIKMFSKGSMLSLVVKNDVYTYEITTLIQYCKSPNTPSLTLIPYELWAKVGNNSVSYH